MKTAIIRGVPLSMQQDGWWLNPPKPTDGEARENRLPRQHFKMIAALIALIALGDVMLWDAAPGLSLAVFAASAFAFAALLWPYPIANRRLACASGTALLALLPLVELVQPLSILFFFAGLPVSLSLLAGRRARGSLRYWWRGPIHSLMSAIRLANTRFPAGTVLRPVHSIALRWGLPTGVGLVFAALLLEANPVLEHWMMSLPGFDVSLPRLDRVFMWLGLAMLCWPAVSLSQFAVLLSPDPKFGPWRGWQPPDLVNKDSILRSLVIFNLLFGLQNVMDVAVLAGGSGLPDGMSYAEYAHRGAYPLIVLALLSGGFALLAQPWITAAPQLKLLLLIWLGQTLWLTLSSMVRLDLYVDVYGLTRLRIAAAVWMGLVAAGLGLILWQSVKNLPATWMVKRISWFSLGAVYLCCFISFDTAIARHNLTHPVERDRGYLCRLSEDVIPVIQHYTGQTIDAYCANYFDLPVLSHPDDWREWGFRNARTRRSVTQTIQLQNIP